MSFPQEIWHRARRIGTLAKFSSQGIFQELPVEAASAVSRRSHGVVRFPSTVEEVISDSVGAGKKGSLRQRSTSLLHELRSRSRSVSRGGVQVLPALESEAEGLDTPSPSAKVRRKGHESWQQKVQSLLKTSGALGLEEAIQIGQPQDNGGLSEPHRSRSAHENKREGHLQYDENQAIAYVASRMPGCYAAIYNIMDELSVRLPLFRPRSMLDFGSGPGTAVWAAQEVWDGSLHDVLAVEASPAMSTFGQSIQAACQSSLEEPAQQSQRGQVRWVYCLPGHSKNRPGRGSRGKTRPSGGSRQYDMVTGAYVIGELDSEEERQNTVDALWASTKHLMILVEPGTPTGYANIMAARTQVLQASLQEEGGKMGAHVVAPCPHDGVCPMEGTKSWCHFTQRFERSGLQRVTKIRPDGGLARTYQDERYSYVVIRKEARPEMGSPLSISRHRQDAAELESISPYLPSPTSWRKSESKMRQAAHLQEVLDGLQDKKQAANEAGPSVEETTELLIRQSMQAGEDEDDENALESLSDDILTEGEAIDEPDVLAAEGSESMIEALVDEEGEGSSTIYSRDEQRSTHTGSAIEAALEAEPQGLNEEADGSDGDGEDEFEVDSEVAAAAAADSWSWGRIIRNPRKRSKHIILDVCTATASMPLHQRKELDQRWLGGSPQQRDRVGGRKQDTPRHLGEEGALVRQVVASSDKRTWLGPAGYRLARKARWGDLWPTHYAQSCRTGGKGT